MKEVFLLIQFFFYQRYKIISLAKQFNYRFTFFEMPVKVRVRISLALREDRKGIFHMVYHVRTNQLIAGKFCNALCV